MRRRPPPTIPTPITARFTVIAVNHVPTFSLVTNAVTITSRTVPYSTQLMTNASRGPANESWQTLSYRILNNTNSDLFAVQPFINSAGVLYFWPSGTNTGNVTLSVYARDNGGTANGGSNTSSTNLFTITITP